MSKWRGEHQVRRRCAVCQRPFSVFLCRIGEGRQGRFCTQECHRVARALFSEMLREGLLEPLLQQRLAEKEKVDVARHTSRGYMR